MADEKISRKDVNLPLVVVNPQSAAGKTGESWSRRVADFSRHFGSFNVEFTKKRGDALRISREAAQNGRRLIIACGGDGTINEVANGILEAQTGAEMGILPSGTGGDFRRTLKIPSDTPKVAEILRSGKTKTIDVGRVTFQNHQGETESRYFVGVSSFGLSPLVIERIKRDKPLAWLPFQTFVGRASFAWTTMMETLGLKHTAAKIRVDDEREREISFVNFCVCNGRYFGGAMKIAPDAVLDDGEFDVVVIGDLSAPRILVNSYKLYAGTHGKLDRVHQTRGKIVTAEPLDKKAILPFEMDGELLGHLPAKWEIVPNALKIRVPK